MVEIAKEPRPTILGGLTIRVQTGCGNMYCKMNWCHGRLFEVFATLGKSGGCASCQTEAVTRLITSALRSNMSVDECVDQLRGLRCPNPVPFPKEHATFSCPDAIANTMIKYGKLSVQQVIELILKANDMGSDDGTDGVPLSKDKGTTPEDKEAEDAKAAIEQLQREREEAGLNE